MFFTSDRTLDLIVTFDDTEGIAWSGISSKNLKSIPTRSSCEIDIEAIPMLPGLRSIAGIKLVDTLLKRTYSYDDLGQVFVIVD